MDQKNNPEHWFNQQGIAFEAFEVRRALDGNVAKLGRDEAKFFLINISPSQKELQHLKQGLSEKDLKSHLKKYAEKVMDEYAKNFQRPGIKSSEDLLWFAKVENHRYYTYKDKEVQDGTKKRGDKKVGDQLHIQVIVSRKDITNKIKLSPMNSSKGRNTEHSKKMGQFDRMAFKQCGEILFDKLFNFERNLKDTLAYANIQKNGNLSEREQLDMLEQGASQNYQSKSLANGLAAGVAKGLFETPENMLEAAGKTASDFLEVLLKPVYDEGMDNSPFEKEQKKRRKHRSQEESQGVHL